MNSNAEDASTEHFVTLFDQNFLPMGMCLHASLMMHAQPFHLWVVCIDEVVESQLKKLDLEYVSLIALKNVETPELIEVKKTRTRGEYCWTLTPFAPQFVIDRAEYVKRVTYLDADLFFFDSPQILIEEVVNSGKQVLITEHAYAPEYDQTQLAGRFCVQFMTFMNTEGGMKVLHWWQSKCIEWCFDRYEEDRFGDQKYLDKWPEIFSSEVHVLQQVEKTLAPWNVTFFDAKSSSRLKPVFYHFQALRIIAVNKVMLYTGYRISIGGKELYKSYLNALRAAIQVIKRNKIEIRCLPLRVESWQRLRILKRKVLRTVAFVKI